MTPLLIPIVGTVAEKVLDRLLASPSVPVTPAQAPVVRQEVANAVAPVIEHLTNNEPWYRSRVTIGALTSIVSGILALCGFALDMETIAVLVSTVLAIVGGILGLYGRWKARKPLGAK